MLPILLLTSTLFAAPPNADAATGPRAEPAVPRRRLVLSANVIPDALLAYGPLWSGEGIHAAEAEGILTPWVGLYLGGGLVRIGGGSDFIGNWSGPIGFLGVRAYPFGRAPAGWWVSIDGFALGGDRAGLDAFGPGVSTGYRFQWDRFSLLVGVGARLAFVSEYGSGLYPLPSLQLNPGISF